LQGQAAPAAADLHHRLAGLEPELGGDVALLGELGLLQGHVRALEIGAGVLHVLVEEPPVELVGQVVVVGHVALRLDPVVGLAQGAAEPAPDPAAPLGLELGVGADQVDELGDLALFQHQAAVHIGLADAQPRLGGDPRGPGPGRDPRRQRRAGPVAQPQRPAAWQAQGEVALAHNILQHRLQSHRHTPNCSARVGTAAQKPSAP
jgi:hypothetical protein